jgi:hypothetical protein
MKPIAQHFMVWKAFNNKVYKKTLTSEHLLKKGNEKYLEIVFKLSKGDDVVDGEFRTDPMTIGTKCVFLEKGGIKYILPSRFKKALPLNPADQFDSFLKESDTTIWKFITKPNSAKITPARTLEFHDMIDVFNPIDHTDSRTNRFLKIQAFGSCAKGGKYRLCSEPGSGKNAHDTILRNVLNNVVKVGGPTKAKMETLLYYYQKVIVDEVTSMTNEDVKKLEPLVLTIADETPDFTKHSIAAKNDLNEIDLSQSTVIFTYNNVWNLGNKETFFDDKWISRDAFRDRYPAFLLSGRVTTAFTKLSMPQSEKILEENFTELAELAQNIVYYVKNMHKELHGWDRSGIKLKGRKYTNFECVIDALDVDSRSQAEFDEWVDWINQRNYDYWRMVKYGDRNGKPGEHISKLGSFDNNQEELDVTEETIE